VDILVLDFNAVNHTKSCYSSKNSPYLDKRIANKGVTFFIFFYSANEQKHLSP